jgi:DnaJ-class molecular chaperone
LTVLVVGLLLCFLLLGGIFSGDKLWSEWLSEGRENMMTLPETKYWDSRLPRTTDKQVRLEVDLRSIYEGKTVKLTWHKNFICSSCSGTGAKSPEHLHICPQCRGRGYQDVIQKMGLFQFQSQQTSGVQFATVKERL